MLGILDYEDFKEILEIPLIVEPNFSFNCYIKDYNFNFNIRTLTNEKTMIEVLLDNSKILTQNADVNQTGVNLNYFSDFKDGVFFFYRKPNILKQNLNFLDFGTNLRLMYGSF